MLAQRGATPEELESISHEDRLLLTWLIDNRVVGWFADADTRWLLTLILDAMGRLTARQPPPPVRFRDAFPAFAEIMGDD